ncbi:acyltransferase family protein [Sphaerisporangium fuscum]|uniref:acyltransferase family protein n=1 Tax=Sphaerisporangium fuscum TaxID=2835868 RepID=UPI001BDDC20A|nr:acyltransferase [Sphaerisporangium fuscum]
MRELRELAERTPARRDRHVDLVRAVAITAVVAGHWLVVDVTHDAEGFRGHSILEVVAWTRPLTWLFQVMPLFFLVGGYANAASLTSHLARGGHATGWVLTRTARLVRPTTVLLCGLVAVAVAARAFGVAPSLIGLGVWLAVMPLWFLVAYIAVVVLTPLTYALHRRAGLAVPVVLAGLVGAGDLARVVFGLPYGGQANYLFAWLAVHQLGFSWQDGRLPSRPAVGLPIAAGGLAVLLLLTVAGPYPVSMVDFGDAKLQNTAPPTLALLALAVTQAGLALALHDLGNRWLRRPGPWTAIVAENSVVMTLFLWHMTALVIGVVALYGTDLMPSAAPGSPAWLLLRVPWLAFLTATLAVLVAVFGRVERRGVLGDRRAVTRPAGERPRRTAQAVLTVAGAAAVLAALLQVALAGSAYHGLTGLPPSALAVYGAGAALLAGVRAGAAREGAGRRSGA